MTKLRYDFDRKSFGESSLAVIEAANDIIEDYAAQGFTLTLRQLYYQFVARDLIPNTERSYKRIGSIVNDGRMCGLIDWESIEDRTRNLRELAHWESPGQIVKAISEQYRTERWATQPTYVEVWIEKDALIGVIAPACEALDVPYFSCRGYTSQSEAWRAGRRLFEHVVAGQQVKIFHLGDHDPSGIDMSRDLEDRISHFIAVDLVREERYTPDQLIAALPGRILTRLALNWDQVQEYDPPPNPAKLSDSRAAGYVEQYGYESWELDALEPTVIDALIRDAVSDVLDQDAWDVASIAMTRERHLLQQASQQWADIVEFMSGFG